MAVILVRSPTRLPSVTTLQGEANKQFELIKRKLAVKLIRSPRMNINHHLRATKIHYRHTISPLLSH